VIGEETISPANIFILISQIWNVVILCALVMVAFLVGWDAKRRGGSWLKAVSWAALTLLVFPIGLAGYLFFGIRIKRSAQIVAVLLITGFLCIGYAVFGNPVLTVSSDMVIQQYAGNNYPLSDLKVEKARYNFMTGNYMAMAQSGKSIDTKFAIFSDGIRIIRDDYDASVLSLFNTWRRLSEEYSAVAKNLVSQELGFDNNTTMVFYYENPTDDLKLDMIFDRSLPVDSKVTIRFELTDSMDTSAEGIAKILTDAYKVFTDNGCHFTQYGLFIENNQRDVSVDGVTAADIEGGDLASLLEKARNSDGKIRFACRTKTYRR